MVSAGPRAQNSQLSRRLPSPTHTPTQTQAHIQTRAKVCRPGHRARVQAAMAHMHVFMAREYSGLDKARTWIRWSAGQRDMPLSTSRCDCSWYALRMGSTRRMKCSVPSRYNRVSAGAGTSGDTHGYAHGRCMHMRRHLHRHRTVAHQHRDQARLVPPVETRTGVETRTAGTRSYSKARRHALYSKARRMAHAIRLALLRLAAVLSTILRSHPLSRWP